ncbi:hypothetical protein FV113G1_P10350 (plasmid) [Fusobacterium varium]|nr:hypothetical protein FV113G1_P10350 [Fusobacterium varium]
MKINYKNLIFKNFLPSLFLIIFLKIHTYLTTGILVPIQSSTIGLFFVALIGTFIFWALLDYFQEVTGMVMKENWIGRIIFILGVLAMIYLYKINGRI